MYTRVRKFALFWHLNFNTVKSIQWFPIGWYKFNKMFDLSSLSGYTHVLKSWKQNMINRLKLEFVLLVPTPRTKCVILFYFIFLNIFTQKFKKKKEKNWKTKYLQLQITIMLYWVTVSAIVLLWFCTLVWMNF